MKNENYILSSIYIDFAAILMFDSYDVFKNLNCFVGKSKDISKCLTYLEMKIII